MGEKQSRRPGVGVGTISLLVIFTLLCLATLGLLGVSTAASNQRVSRRSTEKIVWLADAEGQAASKLAEIDAALLALGQPGDEEYFAAAAEASRKLGCQADPETRIISFAVPVDKNSELVTEIVLLPPDDGLRYKMISQSTKVTAEWEPEEGGTLWHGES